MQYNTLIQNIQADIYSNGDELITGDILQAVLLQMVSAWAGAGAMYGGVITPASAAPADLDQATVYLALTAGTYTNFVDSNNDPIVTTGPALITYDGGASLVFAKTDLPSGGSGATVITNDGSDGDSVAIRLTDNQVYKRSFRIDMTGVYTGGDVIQRIGSLIIECFDDASDDICHGYYYGDDMSEILIEVAIYQDEIDPDTFYLMLQHESVLDSVTFAINPTDGGEVDAFITNAGDDHTKIADATISPVGGSSEVFVATHGSTTYQQVSDAITDNKMVYLYYNSRIFILSGLHASRYTFVEVTGSTIYNCSVDASSNWTNVSGVGWQNSADRVSTISGNETSLTKYPNTKAVYDYVSDIVGDIETLLAAI